MRYELLSSDIPPYEALDALSCLGIKIFEHFMKFLPRCTIMHRLESSLVALLSISGLAVPALTQSGAYGQCGGIGWSGATTCVSGYSAFRFRMIDRSNLSWSQDGLASIATITTLNVSNRQLRGPRWQHPVQPS